MRSTPEIEGIREETSQVNYNIVLNLRCTKRLPLSFLLFSITVWMFFACWIFWKQTQSTFNSVCAPTTTQSWFEFTKDIF